METSVKRRVALHIGNAGSPDCRTKTKFDNSAKAERIDPINPFHGDGRITKRNAAGLTRTIGLNTTACLAAIETGRDHVAAIASLYDLREDTLCKTLKEMEQDGIIERAGVLEVGNKLARSAWIYGLSEEGRGLVGKLRRSSDAFFLECERWIGGCMGKARARELEKAEGKDF